MYSFYHTSHKVKNKFVIKGYLSRVRSNYYKYEGKQVTCEKYYCVIQIRNTNKKKGNASGRKSLNEKYVNLALSQVHHLQTAINRQRNMNKLLVITDTEFKDK